MKPGFKVRLYPFARFSFLKRTHFASIQPGFGFAYFIWIPVGARLGEILSEWQSFYPLIPELTEDFQIFALDLRGHGKSGRCGQEYRILDYCKDIRLFLEQAAAPAALYGHSLGALITMAANQESPGDPETITWIVTHLDDGVDWIGLPLQS